MRPRLKITINTSFFENPIIAFFLIFPFIKIYAFQMDIIEMTLVGIFWGISIIFFLFVNKENREISSWALCYAITLSIVTLVQQGDSIRAIYYGIRIFTFIFIAETYIFYKSFVIFRVMDVYITFLLCVNLIFQYINQDYFGRTSSGNFNNFFRSDNELAVYIFAYLSSLMVLEYFGYTRFLWGKIILSYIVLLKAFTVSGIISMTGFLILYVFVKLRIIRKIRLSVVLLGYFIVHILLVFSDLLYIYIDIITNSFFGKALSTQRMYIWGSAVNNILKKPIFGYGVAEGGLLEINYDLTYGHNFSSHNMILEYLIEGGVVLFCVYLMLLIQLIRKADSLNTEYILSALSVLVGMLISEMTIPEIRIPIMYLTYVLIYHGKEFENYNVSMLNN